MKTIKPLINLKAIAFVIVTFVFASHVNAQVIKAFSQRTATATPATTIYNIKGDYTMIGNTNLTLQSYGNFTNNSNNFMEYVDVDSDPNTFNSSSSTLQFSTENGAIPECSEILFAGLYWTGRASDGSSSPEEFDVTIGGITNTYNKRKVKLKGPGAAGYTEFVANPGNIYYPTTQNGMMYSAFVEVTDYVETSGIGEYTVADMALVEGNGGGTGYYGGWGLIVVYENSKMNWRDVTIFDGHAYVQGNTTINYELPVAGFETAQSGPINMKLGVMAGEGDVGISGDYFKVRNWQDNAWVSLSHSGNSATNFYNSSVNTGGNPRNPTLQNNTGLDIAMFDVPNPSNSVVTNSQTSTRFQYGSTQDTYTIFCIAMSVDAYIPDVESLVSTESINGVPVGAGPVTVNPGEDVEYQVQIKNLGTEAIDNAQFVIPIPYTTSFVPASISTVVNFAPLPTPNNAYFDPLLGPTGSVVWDFGTLPLTPANLDSVLAELTFHLEVTTDCYVLTNPDCPPQVVLTGGTTSGVGATSGANFDLPFIQGYEDAGVCIGEPITEPLVLDIDAAQYIIDNCGSEPTSRDFLFCNYVDATIPFDSIAQDFPSGVSFYNENNITQTATQYDENNPFPAAAGTNTYFAIPDGINFCYYTFTITVQDPILSSAVQTSQVSCLGGNDGQIDLTVLGGIPPYTYDWSGPGVYTNSTQDISSLYEGTYDVIIADSLGCTSSDGAIITTIPDVTDPTIVCPSNISVNNDSGVCGAVVTYSTPVGIDNCNGASTSMTLGLASTATFPIGTTLVEYTVTDTVGNSASCSFNVTVIDIELPTITCPTDVNAYVDAVGCTVDSADVSLGTPAVADNCGIAVVSNDAPATFPIGSTMITWNVQDVNGNVNTCTQEVIVLDTIIPSISSCGAVGTQNVVVDAGVCTFTQSGTGWDVVATDNCTISTSEYTLTGSTSGTGGSLNSVVFNIGTTTVTWIVTDDSGNSSTCSFDVIVSDDQAPVISSCGGAVVENVEVNIGSCTYTNVGTGWDAVATDNCTIASLNYVLTGATTGTGTSLSGIEFSLGTTTVTWTVIDNAGNTDVCTFDVIVTDSQDPAITSCGASGTQNVITDLGTCSFTNIGTGWDATATDNCTVSTIEYNMTGATTGTGTSLHGIAFNLGTTAVTWTATDNSGNTDICTFDVVVTDNQDPVITSCGAIGTQNEVVDNGVCTFTVSGTGWDATAIDNCTVSTIIYDLTGATTGTGITLDGVAFNTGTTTVTWTATDGVGNTDVCVFDVVVTDDQDPMITSCGATGTQNEVVDNGVCTFTVSGSGWDATATDNCTVSTIIYELTGATTGTGTSLDGIAFNLGTTTVTWTVTDEAGNTDSCMFDVVVTDDQNPMITSCGATGTQNVEVDFNVCTYTNVGTGWDATATDNCTISTINYTLAGATAGSGTTLNGLAFNLGTTTVTWTVTDAAGNTDFCTFDVVVTDTQLPVITSCGGVGTVHEIVDPAVCTFTMTGTGWDAIATDNCTVSTLGYELTGATTGTGTSLDGIAFNLGTTTVTWTVSDAAGNTDFCSFNVVIADTELPAISSCGATGTQNEVVDNGVCTFTVSGSGWDATATDNCTVSSINYSLTGATTGTGTTLDGVSFNIGTTTVTWTVTDGAGNIDFCTFDVVVTDDQDPAIVSCGATGTQNVVVDGGLCSYTLSGTGWDATATDNCTVSTLEYALTGATTGSGTSLDGITFNLGTTTVTWTATDAAGNEEFCTFDVIVADTQLPAFTTCGPSGNQTVNANAGICTYTYSGTGWDAIATDNCTVSTVDYVLSGATSGSGTSLNGVAFNLGITTVTWTATDGAGNSVTCTFLVTVLDDQDPSILSCGAIGTQNVSTDLGVCTYTQSGTGWDATATDNCSIATISYALSGSTTGSGTSLDGVTFGQGITTVIWTATDGSGNAVTCSFDVVVSDNETPSIIGCLTSVDVNNDSGECGAIVTWIPPTFSDNCGATMTASHNPGDFFPVGTTTVTYTVSDAAENTAVCTFDVIVTDNELPQMVCPTDINSCDSLVIFTAPTATDNCGVVSVTQTAGLSSGSFFPVGTSTVTYEAVDVNGNTFSCSFNVTINPTPILSTVTTDVTCFGDGDGSIDLTVTNGTLPYTFTWSNSESTEDISGLEPGIYSVTATDANGCMASIQDTISQPDQLVLNKEVNHVNCYDGTDGMIDLTISGGVLPYSFQWSNSAITEDLTGVGAGVYSVIVTDANNCEVTDVTTIIQPDSISIQSVVSQATCNAPNGSINTQVTGGVSPYDFDWSDGSTNASLTNVIGGVYTLIVTDANNCTATYVDSVGITSNIDGYVYVNDVACNEGNDGSALAIIESGNAPFEYEWSTGETSNEIDELAAGNYSLFVTDAFGCDINIEFEVIEPDAIIIDLISSEPLPGFNISLSGGSDGSIQSNVSGGVEPYAYQWSNGSILDDINGLSAGTYSVIVTDDNGCVAQEQIILIQPRELAMPEGVSPNGDNENDFFVIRGIEAYGDNELIIYNRWGNIVYQKNGYNNEWHGENMKGEPLPDGTYFAIFKPLGSSDVEPLTGYIDLRRAR